MALQVWLPLNGNINNQGLSETIVTNYGTAICNDGKIGKCISFVGNGYIQLSKGYGFAENQDFSICYWIKEITNNTLSQFRVIYQIGNLIIGHYGKFLNIYDQAGGIDIKTEVDTTDWKHCTITFTSSNKTLSLYIDGYKKLDRVISSYPVLNNTVLIGKRNTGTVLFEGYLNDFRLYDNALSPKEVKEISKGLLCHYSMGNLDGKIIGRNLLVNTNQGKTKWSNSHSDGSYSIEAVEWLGVNAVKMSCTTKATSWKMFTHNGLLPNFDKLEAGETYKLSYDTNNTVAVGFQNLMNSNALNSIVKTSNTTYIDTSYGRHYETTITLKDTLTKDQQVVYLMNNLNNGQSVIIANLKLEKGTKASKWTPAPEDSPSLYDNIICDISGFGNNGTVTDSTCPTIGNGSPRYDYCYTFNGVNQYVNCGTKMMAQGQSALTISLWCYMDDWTKFNARIYSCTENGGYNLESGNSKLMFSLRVFTNADKTASSYTSGVGDGSGYLGIATADLSSGWHLFTFVYDLQFGTKVYLDGKLYSSGKFTSYGICYNSNMNIPLYIGCEAVGTNPGTPYFNGKISDFRLYGTALSDQDIMELYNTPVSLTNNGTLITQGEFIEE